MTDIVVPYFDAPERLTSILLALSAQVDPATGALLDDLTIIVADDASRLAPKVGASTHPVFVVKLDEVGYHAAAARNRGAAAGSSEVIVFLDGDTVPAPDYVARMTRPIVDGVASLTTGRRRHGDFAGLSPREVATFVADPDPTRLLGEPSWLDDGLQRTDLLRSAVPQVFQYVISAVLAVERSMFDEVGGFDERFDSYGGEDWEFAYRCWNDGGDFLHVRNAVAFHDGPDVEGRRPDPTVKTIETLRVTDLVPASPTRVADVRYSVADIDVGVTLRSGDLRANAICILSLLGSRGVDIRVRLAGDRSDVDALSCSISDDRVVDTATPDRSSRCHVSLSEPLELAPSSLERICRDLCNGVAGRRRVGLDTATLDAWSVRSAAAAARDGTRSVEIEELSATEIGVRRIPADDLATWCRRRIHPPDGANE